jgi:hypothetical protein
MSKDKGHVPLYVSQLWATCSPRALCGQINLLRPLQRYNSAAFSLGTIFTSV